MGLKRTLIIPATKGDDNCSSRFGMHLITIRAIFLQIAFEQMNYICSIFRELCYSSLVSLLICFTLQLMSTKGPKL